MEYASKRLELFDPSKLVYLQQKTKRLNDDLLQIDPQSVKDLKHDREEIEEWYQ